MEEKRRETDRALVGLTPAKHTHTHNTHTTLRETEIYNKKNKN